VQSASQVHQIRSGKEFFVYVFVTEIPVDAAGYKEMPFSAWLNEDVGNSGSLVRMTYHIPRIHSLFAETFQDKIAVDVLSHNAAKA
jgi:hypothetical protein